MDELVRHMPWARSATERGVAVSPAELYEALVIMRAVCAPHPFAPERPAREREARVDHERREHEDREPERPMAGVPAQDAERGREKAERDRAGITHEHLCRRKVEDEERGARGGDASRHHREDRIPGEPGR